MSNRATLLLPGIICLAMLVSAAFVATIARIDPRPLIIPYFWVGAMVTFICVNILVFHRVARMALRREPDPIPTVLAELRSRAVLLLLPAIIWPLFLASYTTAKTGIPFLVGYSWEAFWADADRSIFGADAWQITHAWFGPSTMPAWNFLYTWAWGAMSLYVPGLIALYASRRTVAVFFTAMLGTWFFGGFLMAYALSAAGPIYAHLVDPALNTRFLPLRTLLEATLEPTGVRTTQAWLAKAMYSHIAVKGGGVSAMPSMHLGACAVYVLAASRTKWFAPAVLFWVLIFIASAHVGYHYWVDGIVAAGVAFLCWKAAEYGYARYDLVKAAREPLPV